MPHVSFCLLRPLYCLVPDVLANICRVRKRKNSTLCCTPLSAFLWTRGPRPCCTSPMLPLPSRVPGQSLRYALQLGSCSAPAWFLFWAYCTPTRNKIQNPAGAFCLVLFVQLWAQSSCQLGSVPSSWKWCRPQWTC